MVSLLMFIHTLDSSNCKLVGACQKWKPVRLAEKVILGIFLSFSQKAHNYYPVYHIGPDFLTEKSRHYGILFMKTFYNMVNAIICCAKEARALIVLDIEWVQFVLQNCEKLQNYKFK